jgi:3-isopropylmalate/(R)-2-methylmalate dehydratase large subunit
MKSMHDKSPRTMFEKIWSRHRIMERDDGQVLLYVDRHWVHDITAPAFAILRQRGIAVHAPARTFASPDHYIPTDSRDPARIADPEKRVMFDALKTDAASAGITYFGLDDPRQGIMHVMGPEQGLSLPGTAVVCGDSHTSTHGAVGALAFGIGATEVAHVLATQSIWQRKPRTMRISVDGALGQGVTAKDLILTIIARIGASGATGYVIEYAGSAIERLTMEGRLTVCNMSIEAGARAGMIAPDETTFAYFEGRPYSPSGEKWERAVAGWRTLPSDPGACFDREVTLDADEIPPMITWGTSPEEALPITGCAPDPSEIPEAEQRALVAGKLDYMGLRPGDRFSDLAVDRVFIGSCTNGRIEDLRSAARIVEGRKVAAGVEAWVVPGSGLVKSQAEAEGLDRIFHAAGFKWRHAGCSMCLGTNGDIGTPGQRCVSTTNRNFVGRQGPGVRTHLASPITAVAAAVTGRLTDVRTLI